MARGARAALHREPHGLVQHQHVGVLVERDRLEEIAGLGIRLVFRRARPGLVQPQRRDTHRLSGLEPLLGLRALAVHAQLAFADHTLDTGERQPGETRLEEAVDAHAGFVRAHLGSLHAGRRRHALGNGSVAAPWFGCRALDCRGHGHRRSSSAGAPAQPSRSCSPRIRSVIGTLLIAPSPQQRAPMCHASRTR